MVAGGSLNLYNLLVHSDKKDYQIIFGDELNERSDESIFLFDSNLSTFLDNPKSIQLVANENEKNLISCEKILCRMYEFGATRDTILNVIGGGFTQDIGTLVASLYMRGIKWKYFPSTLAAMGDSCIGGKSSINVSRQKNLIGNIYPPEKVIIDAQLLITLPEIEKICGYSEIIKICYAKGLIEFTQADALIRNLLQNFNLEDAEKLVYLSLKSKKYFVEVDEFDQGVRKLLNFGHTFGHALESASNFKIPHGVSVLFGMLAAMRHSKSELSEGQSNLESICLLLVKEALILRPGLLDYFSVDLFKFAIKGDKKNSSTHLKLILPSEKQLDIVSVPFANGAVEEATECMLDVLEDVK